MVRPTLELSAWMALYMRPEWPSVTAFTLARQADRPGRRTPRRTVRHQLHRHASHAPEDEELLKAYDIVIPPVAAPPAAPLRPRARGHAQTGT